MEIAQTTIDGKIVTSISQTDNIRKFLDDNDIHPGRPIMSPVCNNKEDLYTDQTLVTGEEAKWYSSTFGMLQYFCTKTRFDIALTLSRLGTYLGGINLLFASISDAANWDIPTTSNHKCDSGDEEIIAVYAYSAGQKVGSVGRYRGRTSVDGILRRLRSRR
jgi:hypothetical protein